jgi:RES domain-containing protein
VPGLLYLPYVRESMSGLLIRRNLPKGEYAKPGTFFPRSSPLGPDGPFDGRWHLSGRRIVYTAQSLSLAQLEVLAHIADRRQFPPLVYAVAEIPAALRIEEVEPAELPADWRRYAPYLHTTQAKGVAWLTAGDSAVLRVPSSVSEEEWNFLLNPEHEDFAKIALGTPRILSRDPRVP